MALCGRDDEDEASLMRRADTIYRIMEMIYSNRDRERLEESELAQWFSGQIYPETDYIDLGVENGWIIRAGQGIEITPYGKTFEEQYWKTFR